MILPYIVIYSIFWIVYYILVGARDANIIMWQQTTSNIELTDEQKLLSEKYNERWQDFGVYAKLLLHIVAASTIFLISGNVLLFISLILLSFSIKLLAHNYFINKFRNINTSHIDTEYWTHMLLIYLEKKGISQWVFKFSLLIISIVLITLILI